MPLVVDIPKKAFILQISNKVRKDMQVTLNFYVPEYEFSLVYI